MQVLALVWGILAFVGFLFAMLPCLGWLNWVNIPMAIIGVGLSIVAMVKAGEGPKGKAVAGLILSIVAVAIGAVRLLVGGGVV